MDRHLLITTDNIEFSRTANLIASAESLFDVQTIPWTGNLWRLQIEMAPPLYWMARTLRRSLAILNLRRVGGEKYCYFQDLDVFCILLCKIHGFASMVDVVEPFSLAALDYSVAEWGGTPWLFWRLKELVCFSLADVLIVVCPEYAEWVQTKSKKHPLVVENFPDTSTFLPSSERYAEFSVVYFGGDSASRSLSAVDRALEILKKEIDLRFHVIGPPSLLKGLSAVDCYHGYLPDREAAKIIGKCHVGVSPYRQNIHTNYTLPNKSFQYAACCVLPIGPSTPPMARFSELGVFLIANTTQEWIQEVRRAYERWLNNPESFLASRSKLLEKGWTGARVWKNCLATVALSQSRRGKHLDRP